MSSLREIKSRIASVKSTLKITSAMKMVASAKLHKAQMTIGNKLPYEQKLHSILAGLLQDDDLQKALSRELGLGQSGGKSLLALQDIAADAIMPNIGDGKVAIVAFSSNGSLCGGFNANVIRQFGDLVSALRAEGYGNGDIEVYAVGSKVAGAAVKMGIDVVADLSHLADKPTYDGAVALAGTLMEKFSDGSVSQVILLYSHLASASSQPVVRENYLPLPLRDYGSGQAVVDYVLEPDPVSIVRTLLPKVLFLKLYTVLLDAGAAEHAARTMAMQIASDNAENLLGELTLAYNKGRQQEITSEILDLASGAVSG